jgi:hypothetical protein
MMWTFKRYEFKSLVRADARDRIEEELRSRMAPDPNAAPDGSYRLTSLYYDTPDLRCYRSVVDGIKYRQKLRIRLYGDGGSRPDTPAMVEIKQRIGRTIQKRRVMLPLGQAEQLCTGRQPRVWKDRREAGVAAEVESLVRTLSLRPSCIVGYRRRAFVGTADELNLRVTFDERVSCWTPDRGLGLDQEGTAFIPDDWVVLEVKVDHAIPLWINQLLARYDTKFHRLSKYRLALSHLSSSGRGLRCG